MRWLSIFINVNEQAYWLKGILHFFRWICLRAVFFLLLDEVEYSLTKQKQKNILWSTNNNKALGNFYNKHFLINKL